MSKVIIVMPAYKAEHTLAATYANLPSVYDEVILCDDASPDRTTEVSRQIPGIQTITHSKNTGYGGNQKTLYTEALRQEADIVVMVHPDNQYSTERLEEMIELIASNQADLVLGSRIKTALSNNMPTWKFWVNRSLSWFQNFVYRTHLSEFHSGLRAYRADMLRKMPFTKFSDNFSFDSEVIAWTIANRYKISEVDAECYYREETSSINFKQSIIYGLSTLKTLGKFCLRHYHTEEIGTGGVLPSPGEPS